MANNELNSFVYKYNNLWRTGQKTNLNVKCNDGNAWVELGVCLGHPLDLPHPQLYRDTIEGIPMIAAEIGMQMRELPKKLRKAWKMIIKKVIRIPRMKPRLRQNF